MFGGFMTAVVQYLYEEHRQLNMYNAIDLYLGTPVYMILGALIGLLIVAWLASD
jgi:hypothetical protein